MYSVDNHRMHTLLTFLVILLLFFLGPPSRLARLHVAASRSSTDRSFICPSYPGSCRLVNGSQCRTLRD